ncbi:TPA: IPT/TIG domain-containing protein [Legionella bozemanae]|uniref:IPT/TIG domain-containing protein n=1 Tax=Legionella bozemanae TaxID=447 RepID=UPI00073072D2|nr:IPT/TIG domain-containing protein [Legionella bozemanae]
MSLTNQHLGFSGPLNWGVTYSDLTGTYYNAQYVLPLGSRLALSALGEYGSGQYRLNGTLGYGFSPLAQMKFTAERFGQRLPFQFDSGDIESRVHQDAYGVRFQQLFNLPFLQGFNLGGYYADASSKELNPIIFTSNGDNCGGFVSDLQCINYRHLAGATSTGADAGIDVLLTPSTLVSGSLYYDQVRYNPIFSPVSEEDRNGLGGGIKLNQLLGERLKLTGEATVREIYDTYQAGFSWLPNFQKMKLGIELSLFGQHVTSHNTTPDNNSIGLQVNFLADGNKRYDERHRWGSQRLSDITQWVSTPAVKMNQVFVIAEQITKLLAPSIIGITPNSGPLAGGNTVTIMGSNFVQGLLVFFGGQPATNIQVLSSNSIHVTVPTAVILLRARATVSDKVVDVVVQNPDGQQTSFPEGYTYIGAALTATNPSDATQNVGQTAAFSTTASGGTLPYTYQWQVSTDSGSTWTDISGATATSYTTPTLVAGDNGNQYRMVVTDAASDTVITTAATLTVISVGDAYGGGVIYRIDGSTAYIISPSDVATAIWGPFSNVATNAINTFNISTDNTYTVLAGANFPAAEACRNYTAGSGVNTWFLPAQSEWALIVADITTINSKSGASGFTQFATDSQYWSSTQFSNIPSVAYTRLFTGPDSSYENENTKTNPWRIRCVRALTL